MQFVVSDSYVQVVCQAWQSTTCMELKVGELLEAMFTERLMITVM